MKNTKLERLSIILVFGSLWGIIEASLGYALHLLPSLIAGSFMFPVVFFILLRAHRAGIKRTDILLIGLVAAIIKSVNLLLPALSVFKTINPMIAIVLESLVVFALIPYMQKEKLVVNLTSVLLASILWRGLYMLYMTGQYLATGFVASQLSSFSLGFEFLVLGGLVSGGLALIGFALDYFLKTKGLSRFSKQLWLGIPAFALAIILTVIL